MNIIGRARQRRLNKAISKLVDARLKSRELFVADIGNNSRYIGIRRHPWEWEEKRETIVARWRSTKSKPAEVIDYEEADRLIRKHLGYGEKHD